jgi:rRNA maturation protein Rpf1
MRTLCRDLNHSLPSTVRINRGKLSLEGIAEKSVELNAEKVIIIERWKHGVGKILFFNVESHGLKGIPPMIYIRSVKFRREFEEQAPKGWRIKSIAIAASPKQNFEVEKLENALSNFFTVPVLPLEEIVKRKYDATMQILTDPLKRITVTFRRIPEMVEVGPRVSIWRLIWELKE